MTAAVDTPESSFERLYEDEVRRIYGFVAYRVGGRRSLAEDLTQQVFERALRGWQTFNSSRGNHSTWLFAIARNTLVDHYRSEASQSESVPLDQALHVVDPEPSDTDLSADLAMALGRLSLPELEVIALRFGASMKGPEIAEVTDKSVANVHQIQSRALKKLREALATQAGGVGRALQRTA